jgi:dipeptidyl aminopeptidase/acylaminoacyl peptidase
MRILFGAFAALVLASTLAAAQPAARPATVVPPDSLVLDGVPPIRAAVAEALEPYGEFRPHAMLSWHPLRREMLVRRRLHATNQVHLVTEPGVAPEPLTDFPDAVADAWFEPSKGSYFLFMRAEGGNEVYRLYRQDMAGRTVTPLSPEGERVSDVAWTRRGDRIAYATQAVDRNNHDRRARTTVHVMNPLKPASDRVIARLDGGGWTGLRFSEDGRRLALVEYISANESHLWVMDAATGKRWRVTPGDRAGPVAYGNPVFSRDGRALFATSDRGSEFRRLVRIPFGPAREQVLTPHIAHDVDDFDVSFDARRIAFTTNEDGADVLRFIDLVTLKELPRPPLVQGVIRGLLWRPHSDELAFQVTSARSAGDVFTYDVRKNQLARWTNGNSPALNTSAFVEPRTIRWKSFDGREITGLHYHPPERFKGKRPVIVSIHGGPESQARPGFIGRNNYLVGELGVALVYPNVRGSSGFGKTFLKLDNGKQREDAVKDIGALLDWIKAQPDLDASRVLIVGGSYGGYMALACATHFADRIAGAQSIVGISDFVTFLERTESYRRDLRRAEYGDERDPAMREFLESISPLSHAERITKPLLVAQGANDPRVPRAEAEQIVASLKRRGTPVWFILATDEGHGFAKKPNADFLFYATVEFIRETLLKAGEPARISKIY